MQERAYPFDANDRRCDMEVKATSWLQRNRLAGISMFEFHPISRKQSPNSPFQMTGLQELV